MRTTNLLDSGISGAVTGGALRGITVGRRVVPAASLTAGLFCTILQLGYNEFRLRGIQQLVTAEVEKPVVETIPLSTRLLGLLGVTRLSDEEYLLRLKAKKEILLAKIEVLERDIAENKSKEDHR